MSKARDRYRILAAALAGSSADGSLITEHIDVIVDAIAENSTDAPWDCSCCRGWRDTMRDRAMRYLRTDQSEWDLITFDRPHLMPDHLREWLAYAP